jgi:hypothetical protein
MDTSRQTTPGPLDNGHEVPPDRTLPPLGRPLTPLEEIEAGTPLEQVVLKWIEQNRTAAMLGAFAAGAVLGLMLRR